MGNIQRKQFAVYLMGDWSLCIQSFYKSFKNRNMGGGYQ